MATARKDASDQTNDGEKAAVQPEQEVQAPQADAQKNFEDNVADDAVVAPAFGSADVDYGKGGDEQTVIEPSGDSVAAPTPSRNPLWQSGTASTDGVGPTVEDVSHVFEEARAAALGQAADDLADGEDVPENVVLPEDTTTPDNNEEAIADLKDSAKKANDDLK